MPGKLIRLFFVITLTDIGDRIALSNVDDDTDPTGSLGWIVEGMSQFVCYVGQLITALLTIWCHVQFFG
jgi:hypothetical protein